MDYEDLLVEKDEDGVAAVRLNVPDKLNAITRQMSLSLARAAQDLALDDDVRVVIVTGSGRAFCSGADVSMMAGRSDGGGELPPRSQRLQQTGAPHYDAFPRLEKPVIGAINGPCVGGGLSLALSCDIRIAADNAFFSVAQVARALVPDFGLTHYLPMAVGTSRALELMFTAERFTAAQAKEWGMVSQLVPAEELLDAANALAARIAAQPPMSIELTKKMVWRGLFDGLMRQVDLETWGSRICFQTEDHRESVKAFMNKLPTPRYQGR